MQTKVHKMLSPTQPIPTSPYKYKEPSDKVYVVAGNFSEYTNYKSKKISEGSRNTYYYVTSVEHIRGLSEIKGVFIGTWKSRSDIREIEHQINIIKQKMASASAASVAAGIIAQEIDNSIIQDAISAKAIQPIQASWTDTTGISATTVNTILGASATQIGTQNLGQQQWFQDMMKKYIDEALKNPSTRGGI